ncbi:MAG: hypothetical protein ACRD03_03400 [Acidimicrobiales bacterium]
MALSARVDWKAAADGAWLAVAVTLPPTIVVRLFKDGDLDGQESYLWVVPVLALLVGFALGGHRAARRRPDAPLLHAAVSAACAFTALAALAVVRRLLDGDGLTVPLVVTLLLLLQITVSLAVVGGYVAMRREAASAARPPEGTGGGGGPVDAAP